MQSDESNADTPQAIQPETESGKLRWWRPDLVYRSIRSDRNWSRRLSLTVTILACSIGPFMNDMVEYNRRQQARMNRKKQRIKREEKWRLEAQEEYKNGE